MNGSRAADAIRAWVDVYTRGLPPEVRRARLDEIDDDLWCELEEAAADGRSGRAVARDLTVRWILGIPADVSWSLAERSRPTATVETSPSMTDRTLGTWAAVAGLIYLALGALFIAAGDALWTGGMGGYVILASLAGGASFAIAGVGLAWHHQERLGRAGAAGGGLVGLGALVTMAGPPLILALGSALLMWELGRAGVIWLGQAAVHVVVAVTVLAVFGLGHPSSADPVSRAATMAAFVPYVLSWVAIGISLVRHNPAPAAAGTA